MQKSMGESMKEHNVHLFSTSFLHQKKIGMANDLLDHCSSSFPSLSHKSLRAVRESANKAQEHACRELAVGWD